VDGLVFRNGGVRLGIILALPCTTKIRTGKGGGILCIFGQVGG